MTANIRQSLIILGAVGIGVSIIIFVPSINLSFFNDLIDKSVASAPNITITKELDTFNNDQIILDDKYKGNILLKDQTITRKRNIKSYKKVLSEIKGIKGINAAAPFVSGQGIAIRGAQEIGVSVKGIDPNLETRVVDIEKDIIEGGIRTLTIDDVVIGNMLADKLNVKMGDRITIFGSRGESKTVKITGIFSTGLRAKDEGQVYVNLKSGQQLFSLENDVSGVGIKIDDVYAANKIADEVHDATGLKADSWMEDNKQILEQVARFKVIIAFINFLIIFAAATSITSVLVMMIASKSKEIGILKSIGARSFSIMIIFVGQAIFLGILGYCVGIIGAKLLIAMYSSVISHSSGTFLTTKIPVIKLNIQYAVIAFIYSVVTSIFASIIPAYQAAKLNPVEAINA
ncbi:MAG: FtsX-like permease family protein [bacterium]